MRPLLFSVRRELICGAGDLFTNYDDKAVFTEDIAIKGVRPPLDKAHSPASLRPCVAYAC